jgi:surface carbohydrate biosynthesis protein
MNIYIDVEITSRELDSKLLLAIIAASKGHKVIVSHLTEIILGLKSGALAPGIFHTTNLAPSAEKILRHKNIIKNGSIITSMDEEGGLVDYGYEKFAKVRYSDQTLEQATAVFGWGLDDVETLKKIYNNYSKKIYITGSPRADLWKPLFYKYWGLPKKMPKRPYLLVSSNMYSITRVTPFHKNFKFLKQSGYFNRDPELFFNQFKITAEDCRKTGAFVEAIMHLAYNSNGYDIVVRPHPTENIEAWKIFLEDIPNVKVIQNQSITPWVNNAFAIMHNGCTTAIEATISHKPVITFIPFKQEFSREIPNKLGYRAKTLKELNKTVNFLFNNAQSKKQKSNSIPKIISKKFYFDKKELAAEKIVKVWNELENKKLAQNINWIKLYSLLKISDLRREGGKLKQEIFPSKFGPFREIYKFAKLEKHDIYKRVNNMSRLLRLNKKIKFL